MDGFERRSLRYTNAAAGLEVYDAWSKMFAKDVLLKVYSRSQVSQADVLAKAAVKQAQSGAEGNAWLKDVLIAREDYKTGNYKVVFVYEKLSAEVDVSVVERDDSSGNYAHGLSSYSLLPLLATNPHTLMSLHEAFSPALNQKVIVKSYQCAFIDEAGSYLREALIQASVSANCPYNCQLLDVSVAGEADVRQTHISLVMERLGQDVEKDIERRNEEARPYTETDLLQFICDVSEGLLHAKKLVSRYTENCA